jgi:hypothetical protein
MCWYMPIILALRRLRQEYHVFKASLDYIRNSNPAWAMWQGPVSNKKKKYTHTHTHTHTHMHNQREKER